MGLMFPPQERIDRRDSVHLSNTAEMRTPENTAVAASSPTLTLSSRSRGDGSPIRHSEWPRRSIRDILQYKTIYTARSPSFTALLTC